MCSLGKVSKYSSQQTVGSNTIPVPGEKGWAHVARTFHNTRNQHKHEQKHASKTQVQHQAGSKNGLGACNGHLHKGVLYELCYKSGIHWQSEKPFFVGKKNIAKKKSSWFSLGPSPISSHLLSGRWRALPGLSAFSTAFFNSSTNNTWREPFEVIGVTTASERLGILTVYITYIFIYRIYIYIYPIYIYILTIYI